MPKRIVAISHQDKEFVALALRVRPDHAEVVAHRREPCEGGLFGQLSREFLAKDSLAGHGGGPLRPVVCFDKVRPVFYELALPPAREDQLEAAVRMQAETVLPLEPDAMRFDWKPLAGSGAATAVLAAVHGSLEALIRQRLESVEPGHVWLTGEAVTAAALSLCPVDPAAGTVVYISRHSAWICFVQEGRFVGGACCEVGLDALWGPDQICQTAAEQLAQDIYHTVSEREGYDRRPVTLITGPDRRFTLLAEYLASLALEIQSVAPDPRRVQFRRDDDQPAEARLYEFFIPLGLGFAAVSHHDRRFELFRALHYRPPARKVRLQAPPLGLSLAAVILMALVWLFASYGRTVARGRLVDRRIDQLQRQFEARYPQMTVKQWHQLQDTRKVLSRMRPDILELWALLHEKTPENIRLDSIACIVGEPVRVAGQARGNDKKIIYNYQDILMEYPGIEKVVLAPINYNAKEKRQYFSVSFEYGPFKSARKKTASVSQVPQL